MAALKKIESENKVEQPKTQLGLKKLESENKVEEFVSVAVVEQKVEEIAIEPVVEPVVELQEADKTTVTKKKKK
jgi:hypothetical protein